jgi:hypothetical protein
MSRPRRTAELLNKANFSRANPGLDDNRKLNRNQFQAIYGYHPLEANLNPQELNIEFTAEQNFKSLLDDVKKKKNGKLALLQKKIFQFNDIRHEFIMPTLSKMDGEK